MNRQVLPSMVLSVLIVCFFAVVLFPLERDHEPADEAADPPVVSQARAPAPPEVVTAVTSAPPPRPAPPPEPEPEPAPPVPVAVHQTNEASPAVVDAKSPEDARDPLIGSAPSAAPSASSTIPEPPAPLVPADPPVPLRAPDPIPVTPEPIVRESPPIDEASSVTIANEPEKTRQEVTKTKSPEQSPTSEMVLIPRSDTEVTVVDSGETLDDVAVRIYGSRSGVETLMHANREVLTRRNGPLRTGLQLWTPER